MSLWLLIPTALALPPKVEGTASRFKPPATLHSNGTVTDEETNEPTTTPESLTALALTPECPGAIVVAE
jgi:hypothetical protein